MTTTSYRDFVETLRGAVDIVALIGDFVPLKKAGRRYKGLCPFHQEKTPSFSVDAERQLFYCFGCQTGGDVFKFVMLAEQMEFPEAVRFLAERAGIQVPSLGRGTGTADRTGRLLKVLEETAGFYRRCLEGPEGEKARGYLSHRGLSRATIKRLGLGFAPSGWDTLHRFLTGRGIDPRVIAEAGLAVPRRERGGYYDRFRDRVVFPIQDPRGRIVGFGGRILGEGEPKYLNSPETPVYEKSRTLYGLAWAREAIRREGRAILVEGYLDVAALLEAGIEGVVAACGTAFSEGHARLLARSTGRVVVNFDGDRAGIAAARRSLDALLACSLRAEVVVLPEGQDPDDVVRAEGAEAYRARLEQARPFIDFLLDRAVQEHDLAQPGALVAALDQVLPHLGRLESPIERARYAAVVAERLGIEDDDLVFQALRKALRQGRTRIEGSARKSRPSRRAGRIQEAEARLLRVLVEDEASRPEALGMVSPGILGAEARAVVELVASRHREGRPVDYADLSPFLPDAAREVLAGLAFRGEPLGGLEEVEACLAALRRGSLEKELVRLQREIEHTGDVGRLDTLARQKMDLVRELQDLTGF